MSHCHQLTFFRQKHELELGTFTSPEMLLEVEDINILNCVIEDIYVDAPPGHLISLQEMCVCPAPNMFRVLTCVMDFFHLISRMLVSCSMSSVVLCDPFLSCLPHVLILLLALLTHAPDLPTWMLILDGFITFLFNFKTSKETNL